MKNLMKAALVSFAIVSVSGIAGAQQLAPQKVLTDLTAEQVKQINGLGRISNSEATTSPVFDFKLSKILTPAQLAKYNQEKDGVRYASTSKHNMFNIDSK